MRFYEGIQNSREDEIIRGYKINISLDGTHFQRPNGVDLTCPPDSRNKANTLAYHGK